MTRKAFENAIAVVMATGGSTNAVLHLLAIARAANVPLALEDFETIRRARSGALRSEAFRQIRHHGIARRRRHSASDENAAGARRAARRRAHHHRQDRSPKRWQRVPAEPRKDQDVIHPWDSRSRPQGHLVILQRQSRQRRRRRQNFQDA